MGQHEAAYIEQGIPLSDYLKTKREADAELKQLSIPLPILKPSFSGWRGWCKQSFIPLCLASLPVIGLPGDGEQQIQPVHIDDLCHAVTRFTQVIAAGEHLQLSLNAVGPEAMSYRQMLLHYRQVDGCLFPLRPHSHVDHACRRQARTILTTAGVRARDLEYAVPTYIAAPEVFERFIKRPVIAPESWFKNIPAEYLAQNAYAMWTHLRFTLEPRHVADNQWHCLTWIVSREQSLCLTTGGGIGAKFAPTVLNSAALLDIVLGVLSSTRFASSLAVSNCTDHCV